MVLGLSAHLRLEERQGRGHMRGMVERVMVRWHVTQAGLHVTLVADASEAADYIFRLTRALADVPYHEPSWLGYVVLRVDLDLESRHRGPG